MKLKKNKILIITGGDSKYLLPFKMEAKKLGLDVVVASFLDLILEVADNRKTVLKIKDKDVASFDVIYIRLIYKCFEEASLLVEYAKSHKVKIVDEVYENARFTRLPIAKSLEAKILHDAGAPFPKTVFCSVNSIKESLKKHFGENYVIKDSLGKHGRDVWSPTNDRELENVLEIISTNEIKNHKRYLLQELIGATQRVRVLVVGGRAIAAMTRPTRWRERFLQQVGSRVLPPIKKQIKPIPKEDADLAVKAAEALSLDIAGVDILHEDKTDKPYVLEVNSAPSWTSISKYEGVNVEREILKYLREK